jgi:hypothetical protein
MTTSLASAVATHFFAAVSARSPIAVLLTAASGPQHTPLHMSLRKPVSRPSIGRQFHQRFDAPMHIRAIQFFNLFGQPIKRCGCLFIPMVVWEFFGLAPAPIGRALNPIAKDFIIDVHRRRSYRG